MIKRKKRPDLRSTFPVPAVIGTETSFGAGWGTLDQQCGTDEEADRIAQAAIKQGYRPSPSDVYAPMLAKRMGDPKAFLKSGDLQSQARKAARANNLSCPGLDVQARPEPLPEGKILAPDIVEQIRRERIRANPALAESDQRVLREEIVDTHGVDLNEDSDLG